MAQLQPLFEKSKTPVFDALVTIIANGGVRCEVACQWLDTVVKTYETLSELHARESGVLEVPVVENRSRVVDCADCGFSFPRTEMLEGLAGHYCKKCCLHESETYSDPKCCKCHVDLGTRKVLIQGLDQSLYCYHCFQLHIGQDREVSIGERAAPETTAPAPAPAPATCSVCVSPLSVGETLMLDGNPYCLTCSSRT